MYRPNQRIRISGAAGEVFGRIEEIRTPAELPALPGMSADEAREILAEWGVSRMAWITYHASPEQQYMFVALEIDGKWFDLHRQELELEIVGFYTCPTVLLN
jgi:hypothetical protein